MTRGSDGQLNMAFATPKTQAEQVLVAMRARHRTTEMQAAAERAVALYSGGLISPAVAAKKVRLIEACPESFIIDDGTVVSAPGWLLKGAKWVYACIATLGPHLDLKIRECFEDHDSLLGFALDALGCLALEGVRDELRAVLESSGERLGPKLSPGCHRMGLDAQRALFRMVDGSAIGVALDPDTFIMLPLKSVSWFWPCGPEIPDFIAGYDSCEICLMACSCQHRPGRE